MARMDIVGSLPTNISEMILSFLSPKDVVNCSAVSKAWNNLSNSDRVWHNICKRYDLHTAKQYQTGVYRSFGSQSRWKGIFKKHIQLTNNWCINKCKKFLMPPNLRQAPVLICASYESTIVIIYSNNTVDVYQVSGYVPVYIQSLTEMSNRLNFIPRNMITNGEIIVVKFDGVISIYRKCRHILWYNFANFLHLDKDQSELVSKMSIENVLNTQFDLYQIIFIKSKLGIIGNTIFSLISSLGKIYLWDYIVSEPKGIIEINPNARCLTYFRDKLYIGDCNQLHVYNQNCEKELSVRTKRCIYKISCNKFIILASCIGKNDKHTLYAWHRHNGEPIFCRETNIPSEYILHQNKACIYYLSSFRTYDNNKIYQIKAYDLYNKKVIWKSRVPSSNINYHSFNLISDRCIIFYSAPYLFNTGKCSVYTINGGKYLYTIGQTNEILLCTDKFIVLREHLMAKLFNYA